MALGEVKSSNIIKFQLPCQFQRFLYHTLCVFSQIKDRKHIEQNFHSVAGVMPLGWDIMLQTSSNINKLFLSL